VSARVYGSGLREFWYRSICAMDIVQGSGRGGAHKDDYCTSYLLDKQIRSLVVDNQNLFPRYWIEAVDYPPRGKRIHGDRFLKLKMMNAEEAQTRKSQAP